MPHRCYQPRQRPTGPRHENRLEAGIYILTDIDNDTDGPNGLPSITSRPTIRGVGADITIIKRANSAPDFRLVHVAAGTLTLEGLTLQGGETNDLAKGLWYTSNVSLRNSALDGNSAEGSAGIANFISGTAILTNSTVVENTAARNGGGVANIFGMLMIDKSILAYNTADRGGAPAAAGGAILTNSTVAENAAARGGGIDGSGSDVLLIDNSTLVDNIASIEGGGYYAVVGRMTCTNSTLAGKAANFGGGLFNSNGIRRDSVTAPWPRTRRAMRAAASTGPALGACSSRTLSSHVISL